MKATISRHKNKLTCIGFATLAGFLADRSMFNRAVSAISFISLIAEPPLAEIQSQPLPPEIQSQHSGLYGAALGFGFAFLMLGIYYCTDQEGKEVRRANSRLSDTISNLMKSVGFRKDSKEIKVQSDLQGFKKMVGFVSQIPELKVPDQYLCPIYKTIMIFPVTAFDGNNYEREALQKWYDHGKNTCPMGPLKRLENPSLLPVDETLSKAIKLYVEQCYKQLNDHHPLKNQYSYRSF